MGRAYTQARDVELQGQFYSIASVTSSGFTNLAGKALNGTYVSNWLIPRNDIYVEFSQKYKSRYGKDIGLEFVAGPTHDAATLVFNTLRKLNVSNAEVTGSQVRNGMVNEKEFNGITGRIKMDKDGAVKTIREKLFRYENGKLVNLE